MIPEELIDNLVNTKRRFPSLAAARAAAQIEALGLVLLQRQTIALERIADRLTPVAVINTPPDQAALFPEIQP